MLRLLLGSGGSGKTTAIYQAAAEKSRSGTGDCILLVPEQYSFETERRMLQLLGPKDGQRVTVVSFRRLVDWVYRRCGKPAGTVLSDGGRSVLMSLALEEVGDTLTYYQGYKDTEELIGMLLSFEKELKQCGVSGEDFFTLHTLAGEATLKQKMEEIGRILSAFEALVAQSYLDPLDDLTRILPRIQEERLFAGSAVFVDGFKDFTTQELAVLRLAMTQGEELTIALCAETLHDEEDGEGLFSPVCKTTSALMRMARENGVTVASPVLLPAGKRYHVPELAFLEQQLFRPHPEVFSEDCDHVLCYAGKSRHDEATFVGQEIRRLVMEEGYRYGDFAVIARNLQNYQGILQVTFDRHKISYFLDEPRPIESEPIIRVVLSALEAVQNRYDTEEVLTYLKTAMVDGIGAEEIALLENYTYLWNITGKQWHTEWTASPNGFNGTTSAAEQEQLGELNRLREKLIAPLERFAKRTDNKTGRECAGAVYDLLTEIGADQCVLRLSRQLRELGHYTEAEEQLRLWELLMDVLDQMAQLLPNTVLRRERFLGFFRLVLNSAEISGIPEGQDQVSVGEAGRMRPADPKVVFLLGAVQEEFPAVIGESGAFCDRERQEMIAFGVPLTSTLDDLELDETYLCYASAVSGSERLYLCWYQMDLTGQVQTPSSLVREIQTILPKAKVLTRSMLEKEREALSYDTAFSLLARESASDSLLSVTLESLLREEPAMENRLTALERTKQGLPRQFREVGIAMELFPDPLRLSASQIETYHLCQFQYFCKYGLRAKERKPAEVSSLEYGRLMHYLLEHLFRDVGHAALCQMEEDAFRQTIGTLLEQYLTEELGIREQTPRLQYLFKRLEESAAVVIRHIAQELSQSQFQPMGFEMTVARDGDFPPLTIACSDGSQAQLSGVIDRVDLYVENDEQYVRVVDYKTGSKEFRLFDILNGINLQMLLYLAALMEGGSYRPAGVLYMPATRPAVSAQKDTPASKVEAAVDKKLRMNGLLLDDPLLLTAMEERGEGKYIPATIKDGTVKSTSTVTKLQLEQVLAHIKGMVGEMAVSLHKGQVADAPLKGSYDGCAYCPYFPICCHEEKDGGRVRLKTDKQKVLDILQREGEEG